MRSPENLNVALRIYEQLSLLNPNPPQPRTLQGLPANMDAHRP